MKNLLRIAAASVIILVGLLAISAKNLSSSLFFNASAQTCASSVDCNDGYNHGDIGQTTYCCISDTGETGHKQGITLPGDPTP